MAAFVLSGEPYDEECYRMLPISGHVMQSVCVVAVSAAAYHGARQRIPELERVLPAFSDSSSKTDAAFFYSLLVVEVLIALQRSYQGTLITFLNPCHLTAIANLVCLRSNSQISRMLYAFYAFPMSGSAIPALLTPDRSGWTLPGYAVLFYSLHLLVFVCPLYLAAFRARPLVDHFLHSGRLATWLFMSYCVVFGFCWFGVLGPISLLSGRNVFYMLCPPGNLRKKLDFLGSAWTLVGHIVLALVGAIYAGAVAIIVRRCTPHSKAS
eukprot:TRINITY_DN60073_c0_g1_i1.p1 TRINITY_DN60073_c0_g1~~TRINITY_DN60073_c0_g1_i1.p1  ORF type:complete len:267 (+),score=13.30 TRINITY_DN60073_c0_g1_i1:281-1081(+)